MHSTIEHDAYGDASAIHADDDDEAEIDGVSRRVRSRRSASTSRSAEKVAPIGWRALPWHAEQAYGWLHACGGSTSGGDTISGQSFDCEAALIQHAPQPPCSREHVVALSARSFINTEFNSHWPGEAIVCAGEVCGSDLGVPRTDICDGALRLPCPIPSSGMGIDIRPSALDLFGGS